MAPFRVQKRLETASRAMKALIAEGVFQPMVITNPIHGGKSKVIPAAQVEDFERTYISLFKLALAKGRHMRKVLAEMNALGIQPAWDPDVVFSRWYRRSEIALGNSVDP